MALPVGTQKVPCLQCVFHVSHAPSLTNLLPISMIENSLHGALMWKVDFTEDFTVESKEMVLHVIDNFITKCHLGHYSPTRSPGPPAARIHFSTCFPLAPPLYPPPELQIFQNCLTLPYTANKIPFQETHVELRVNVFHCHIKLKTIKKPKLIRILIVYYSNCFVCHFGGV